MLRRIHFRVQALLRREDWFESRLFMVLGWTLLCLYMSVQILACLEMPIGEYDESIPLVSSKLVQLGRTPAVDFKSFYPPLYYYVIAAGFHFFGQTVLVVRFLAVVLYVLVIFAAALFFRNWFPHLRPLIPFMTLPVAAAVSTFSYSAWPGYAVALLSVLTYLIGRYSSAANPRCIALSGLLAGISTLMRFNFGPYVLFAVGADIVLAEIVTKSSSPLSARVNRALLQAAAFAVPCVLVNLIFYLVIYGADAIAAPLRMARFSMDAMNSGNFLPVRRARRTLICLAAPSIWIFVQKALRLDKIPTAAMVPAIVSGILIGLVIFTPPTPSISLWFPVLSIFAVIALHLFVSRLPRAALCSLLFYICCQHYLLSRADIEHARPLFPILALTLPFLFASPNEVTNYDRQPVILKKGAVFLALVAATAGIVTRAKPDIELAQTSLNVILNSRLSPSRPDRERLLANSCEYAHEPDDEIQAAEFVRRRTAPSDLIFVGVHNHSGSFVNRVRAYWLSERLPGVSYFHLDSGIVSKERVQLEIIDELQRNSVDWAILYDTAGSCYEDVFTNLRPSSRVLDNFLEAHFENEVRFGRFSVLRRKHHD